MTAIDPVGFFDICGILLEPVDPQGIARTTDEVMPHLCGRPTPLVSEPTLNWGSSNTHRWFQFPMGSIAVYHARMSQENLWAPWRITYLNELKRKADQVGWTDVTAGGFLAEYWARPEKDGEHLIVYRNKHGMVLLNRYPYANGHLMSALGEPRPTLLDYEPVQRASFWRLIEIGIEIMQRSIQPQGINVGINEGRAAGAGVPEHLHAHIVPRWSGDTNFLSVVGQVRVIPEALESMATRYREVSASMNSESG